MYYLCIHIVRRYQKKVSILSSFLEKDNKLQVNNNTKQLCIVNNLNSIFFISQVTIIFIIGHGSIILDLFFCS